jgi:S1-C subfamily serine protease
VYSLLLLAALPGQFTDHPTFTKEQQQAALEATVRIYYPANRVEGSAVIVGRRGSLVYLLTACHNVTGKAENDDVEFNLYTAKDYPKLKAEVHGRVHARMPNEDLAVLEGAFDPPGLLPLCPKDMTRIRKPFPVLTVGCVADGPPTIEFDRVVEVDFLKKPDGSRANFWRAERPQVVGRSGGPLVDARGYVLGICSGTLGKKGYYTEIAEIHAALARNGLDWLYAKPADAGK